MSWGAEWSLYCIIQGQKTQPTIGRKTENSYQHEAKQLSSMHFLFKKHYSSFFMLSNIGEHICLTPGGHVKHQNKPTQGTLMKKKWHYIVKRTLAYNMRGQEE